ncbi:uncharacterized protein LOC143920216 [Arctopsyche grandis]|uniref:uncharacterized protein LOC143920216 n=1 Tax=Arctopsyche grandis TaxID=121162 RepID=UPI00406D9CE9
MYRMTEMLLFLAATLATASASIYTDYYCPISPNHTMCIYQGLSSRCGQGSYGGYLTETEKKTIVDTHNVLRLRIANGQEHQGAPGPQPPASDMQLLEWDDELANIAQMWADQCVFEHDLNRDTVRFNVGQNIFQSEGGVPWEEAIYSWYSEVEFFDKNLVDNFINDKVTDHYSQIVWGNTRFIGCGKRTYPQKHRQYTYRYKRDVPSKVDISSLQIDKESSTGEIEENLRQPRKIYSGQYVNQVQHNQYYSHSQNYHDNSNDDQWKAYNASLYQYFEKYKSSLLHKGDYLKQLEEYKKYLDQLQQFNGNPHSFEESSKQFYDLQNKYETYKNIHDRQLYYEKKLKTLQANKKKLNPVISKHYSFTTAYPVIAGVEHEYYVCNYGPTGNFPGARMYTKGQNTCSGLCQDPMTTLYYPALEQQNDPILSLLYSSQKK